MGKKNKQKVEDKKDSNQVHYYGTKG